MKLFSRSCYCRVNNILQNAGIFQSGRLLKYDTSFSTRLVPLNQKICYKIRYIGAVLRIALLLDSTPESFSMFLLPELFVVKGAEEAREGYNCSRVTGRSALANVFVQQQNQEQLGRPRCSRWMGALLKQSTCVRYPACYIS